VSEVKDATMSTKRDRRKYDERRRERTYVEFPFIDKKGNSVKCDRRKKDDRRTGILVTQACISEKEFAEHFPANEKAK